MSEIYSFIISHLYWFWLAVFILMLLVEAATAALVTIWCAASAFVMIFLSLTGMPLGWQLLLFFLFSALLVVFTRPLAVRKLKTGKAKTNVEAMAGQEVLVTADISRFSKGSAKASNGVEWSACASDGGEISKGEICTVIKVNGNTLVIEKKNK